MWGYVLIQHELALEYNLLLRNRLQFFNLLQYRMPQKLTKKPEHPANTLQPQRTQLHLHSLRHNIQQINTIPFLKFHYQITINTYSLFLINSNTILFLTLSIYEHGSPIYFKKGI